MIVGTPIDRARPIHERPLLYTSADLTNQAPDVIQPRLRAHDETMMARPLWRETLIACLVNPRVAEDHFLCEADTAQVPLAASLGQELLPLYESTVTAPERGGSKHCASPFSKLTVRLMVHRRGASQMTGAPTGGLGSLDTPPGG